MSRKRSAYRPRPKAPPMLVSRGMVNSEIELNERMTVEAFSGGWAGKPHFDTLCDMRNVLVIAGTHRRDPSVAAIGQATRVLMGNIRDRFDATGRMGVTGDELALLREFVAFYRDFWMRQSVTLYEQACDALARHNAALAAKAAA